MDGFGCANNRADCLSRGSRNDFGGGLLGTVKKQSFATLSHFGRKTLEHFALKGSSEKVARPELSRNCSAFDNLALLEPHFLKNKNPHFGVMFGPPDPTWLCTPGPRKPRGSA